MCGVNSLQFLSVVFILTLLIVVPNFGKVHDPKAAKTSTVKPVTTTKITTTAKPGTKHTTTAKHPSRTKHTTTLKPAPGTKLTTTAKPGTKVTTVATNPGRGPNVPPGVTIPPEVPTHTYIGFAAGKHFWLSHEKYMQEDAVQGCKDIFNHYYDENLAPYTEWAFYLAIGEDDNERAQINKLMTQSLETKAWLGSMTKFDINGRAMLIEQTSSGVTITNGGDSTAPRKKREKLVTRHKKHSNKRKRRNRKPKRQTDDDGPHATSVTVKDTHYPWLSSWQTQGGCRDMRGCEPIQCNVTTQPCTIAQPEQPCQVGNDTSCEQVPSGSCNAICEKCEISQQADCWMADSKCEIVKERQCHMVSPDCTVETQDCTVTRPPCITKPAPCSITTVNVTVNETVCETSPPCGTPQGVTCTKEPRECTTEEKEAGLTECINRICVANPLCIKPDYCRPGASGVVTIDCPPPLTFCPPEIVNCPPPKVTCGEPELECTDPEIYCPPPQIICTQPQVICSAPKISCPSVITKCTNPTVNCGEPSVDCPPPTLECNEPTACLVNPPVDIDQCKVKCEGEDCRCQIYQQTPQGKWGQAAEKCDAEYRGLCAGHGRR